MMIATNTMSRIETTDTCDHSAENCGTQNPFQTIRQAGPTAKLHCNLELATRRPTADDPSPEGNPRWRKGSSRSHRPDPGRAPLDTALDDGDQGAAGQAG